MLGNSTEKDSEPSSLNAAWLHHISVTTNVQKFNIVDIIKKCQDAALKGRFGASVDVDYIEKDQRDLLRTLEHYGYTVTMAKEFNEGQNTFYIKW